MKNGNSFWDFSLWIYRQEGVEHSCLELQNNYGCDVNLLLFCCWGGLNYGVLPEAVIGRAVDYSQLWRSDVVQPLRAIRVRMKGKQWITAFDDHETLRGQVKSAELEAERLQQAVLEQLIGNLPKIQTDPSSTFVDIIENIDRYFQKAGIKIDRSACKHLAGILSSIGLDNCIQKLERLLLPVE